MSINIDIPIEIDVNIYNIQIEYLKRVELIKEFTWFALAGNV